MKILTICVLAVALLGAGCEMQTSSDVREASQAGATTPIEAACTDYVVPSSVLSVPPGEMRAALAAGYRLRPDKRFLLAVKDIHRFFVPDAAAETVQVGFVDGRWHLCYKTQVVGDLSELTGFGEWFELLDGWAAKLAVSHPVPLTRTGETASADAEEALGRYRIADSLAVLKLINQNWKDGKRDANDLHVVARALTIASLQKLDRTEIADSVDAQTIAALVLAARFSGRDMTREQALLAETLGHHAYARTIAEGLPDIDPVRLFVMRSDPLLRAVAEGRDGSVEARYLFLLRMAEVDDAQSWLGWANTFFPEFSDLSILKAALALREFNVNAVFAPVLPYLTIASLNGRGSMIGVGSVAERDTRGSPASRVKRLLGTDASSLVAEFEADLARRADEIDGIFLSAATVLDFYRAYFYSGLYIAGNHYRDSLSSLNATKDFNEFIGKSDNAVAADLGRWYATLAQSKAGQANPLQLQNDLTALTHLGAPPLVHTFGDLTASVGYGDPMLFAAAKSLVARMDDRVSHRIELARIAHTTLYDLPLTERLYHSSIETSHDADLMVWHARFDKDAPRLRHLLRQRDLPLKARIKIPDHLRSLGAAADGEVDALYRSLVAEQPDNWWVLEEYIDYLEATKRYEEAREQAQDWLDRHERGSGFPYISASSAVARQYYHLERYQDGWKAIEPVISSQQAGAMGRGALLLGKLGRKDDAESLARAALARYPDSHRMLGILMQIYWQHGKFPEAARLLKNSPYVMSNMTRRKRVGGPFAELFHADAQRGDAAFSALLAEGIDPFKLSDIVLPMRWKGNHEFSFRMSSQLRGGGLGGVLLSIQAYKDLKAWRGGSEALAWLKQQIPPQALNPASMILFTESEFDLLWDLIEEPEQGQFPDAVWLYRAAGFVKGRSGDDARRKTLIDYFSRPQDGLYHATGRHLLGLTPESELLAMAASDNQRCEVAYFLGLRALSEDRLHDASDWFRVATETGLVKMGEYRWAYNELRAWKRAGIKLQSRTRAR